MEWNRTPARPPMGGGYLPRSPREQPMINGNGGLSSNTPANPASISGRRPDLLTVDQALQYSPLTSIVPFNPEMIPLPTANLPTPRSIFSSPSEGQTARKSLDYLNERMSNEQPCPAIIQEAERKVKSLLAADSTSQIRFKSPAKISGVREQNQAKANGTQQTSRKKDISPFADLVLRQSSLNHRYPTPSSSKKSSPATHHEKTKKPREQAHSEKQKTSHTHPYPSSGPPRHPVPAVVVPAPKRNDLSQGSTSTAPQNGVLPGSAGALHDNKMRASENSVIGAQVVGVHVPVVKPQIPSNPPLAVPQSTTAKPVVVIPTPSAESQRQDFISYEGNHSLGDGTSRKRKRDTYLGQSSYTKDQRAESDEAVHQLQDCITELCEAEEESHTDIKEQATRSQDLFCFSHVDGKDVKTLASGALKALDPCLQKVVGLERMGDVSKDELYRVQGLCLGAVFAAEESGLQADDENWSASDLETVDFGLRSARCVLRIMRGALEDKRLYQEETLQMILRLVQKVVNCLALVVEARSSGPQERLFEVAASLKKELAQLLNNVNKVLSLLTQIVAREKMAETIITPLEFIAIGLLFVENAPSEKESLIGIQKFENLRRSAMDLITTICSEYASQRDFLFKEILTSLQKLPTGRQAKRHLKLGNGRAIQIVSALIMELVQTIATSSAASKKTKGIILPDENGASHDANDASDSDGDSDGSEASDSAGESRKQNTAVQSLNKLATSLCNSAHRAAHFAAVFLVGRAQTSSKTGDQPHRQLLDIFVEDLLEVLGMPEWPAAEILLRALFVCFSNIIEDLKSTAPARNMALELLGNIGSAVSELVSKTQRLAKTLENHESALNDCLSESVNDFSDGSLELQDIVLWNGPYHAVVDYLTPSGREDLHKTGAQGYYLAQWGKAVSNANIDSTKSTLLATRLRQMLQRVDFFPFDLQDSISDTQAQVAYALSVLNMDLCRQFDYILKVLLRSINSEQPTVRSRALRSVTQMLEKDPSLLDRSKDIRMSISQCTKDQSPMVRDNALTLITKCIALRPSLDSEFTAHILVLVNDSAVGVRKRALKLLKEMYLRNSSKEIRVKVGDSILQRSQDLDAAVSELSNHTLEEIWLTPFWSIPDLREATAQNKIALREQFGLLVQIAQGGDGARCLLQKFLNGMLSEKGRFAAADSKVCKSLIATGFELFLDAGDQRKVQQEILLTMTAFAQAKPELFLPDQIQILQPYVSNLSSTEELALVKSIVIVFRYVLPALPAIQHELLRSIQGSLLATIQKLSKSELNEAAHCLWKINETLNNPTKLLNLTKSVLQQLHQLRNVNFGDSSQQGNLKKLRKYIWIASAFGKNCNFEAFRNFLKESLPWWENDGDASVAGLVVQSIKPFANRSQPLPLRVEALESIGYVCQAWPRQFTEKHISSAFEEILHGEDSELKQVVLSSFRDFLHNIESQAANKPNEADGSKDKGPVKLGASATASDDDGASTLIAQYFLKDILKVALASQDDSALVAAEVIASINRQGLAHPRSSGSALVALETSQNLSIAQVAFDAHKILHQQHESALEQDYMRAILDAFRYQKKVAGDSLGYTTHPLSAKLRRVWEIISSSGSKYQKKFLSNFCARIDFDVTKIDLTGSPPATLQYSRFLTENLALFDYPRLEELLHTIACMERIVTNTGSGLAHIISTDVFHLVVDAPSTAAVPGSPAADNNSNGISPNLNGSQVENSATSVDPARLYLLTTGSIILSMLWEARTHLRKLYGQSSNQQRRESTKGRAAAKDTNRAPTRVHGVSGDKFVANAQAMVASLDSHEGMLAQCQKFVDLMRIDDEVKVRGESDEEGFDRPETPSLDDDDTRDTPMSGSTRGHKRKSSTSISGTPGQRKRGRPSLKHSKSSRKSLNDDDGDDDDADGDWI